MKEYTVYKRIAPDGRIYVGMTSKKLNERSGRKGQCYHGCLRLEEAIKIYGWDSFVTEVVASHLSRRDAQIIEESEIIKHKTFEERYGFNIRKGMKDTGDVGFKKGNTPWNKGINWQTSEAILFRTQRAKECNTGKHRSEQMKERARASNPLKKKIVQYTLNGDLVAEYRCAYDAAMATNSVPRRIRQAASGKARTSGGYIWRFAEEGDAE